ncbi:very short patch repair endonuclease [Sphingomonas colocasiae]|uniref:Very short patch repair endonuclease n=1 Tax=Sphingomonas colocasiae TaxID=1848973 RepID=A0ABS7PTE4_9SPHN|nr:very short patch repair endonuclease [Sphingomonas colocasiae]MBY8824607.1 very short patch repair endonuclease [Sphingomonas colocasiae]
MADIVPADVRSRMMSGIRGTDTKPEQLLRKGLHAQGFRFRLHDRMLPGKPDIVLSRYRAVIFAHGCFWHGHDCHMFRWPSTREAYWRKKIGGNRERDTRSEEALREAGWRCAVIWECALRGRGRLPFSLVIDRLANWLKEGGDFLEITGKID